MKQKLQLIPYKHKESMNFTVFINKIGKKNLPHLIVKIYVRLWDIPGI